MKYTLKQAAQEIAEREAERRHRVPEESEVWELPASEQAGYFNLLSLRQAVRDEIERDILERMLHAAQVGKLALRDPVSNMSIRRDLLSLKNGVIEGSEIDAWLKAEGARYRLRDDEPQKEKSEKPRKADAIRKRVHEEATKRFNSAATGGVKLNKSDIATWLAPRSGELIGKTLESETIRRDYLKDWEPPKAVSRK